MTRRSWCGVLALAVAAAVAGCKRGEPQQHSGASAAPTPTVTSRADPTGAGTRADSAASGGAAVPTQEQLRRYAAYQKALLGRLQRLQQDWANRQMPDTADPSAVWKGHLALIDAARTVSREEAGLSAADEQRLTPLVAAVAKDRALYEQAGGDEALRELTGSTKELIERLPPDKQSRAQAEHREALQALEDLKSARAARTRFGDAAVDRVLADGEVVSLQQQIERALPSAPSGSHG